MEVHVLGWLERLMPRIKPSAASEKTSPRSWTPLLCFPALCCVLLSTMASESECAAVELPHVHLHPGGTEPLARIAVDYCPEACRHAPDDGEIHVTYDDRGGARWRSRCRFLPGGAVAATIRAPAGDTAGLNYNLYLSSLEGSRDMDEIDFEFLGHDKCAVQTNFHVAGGGGREQIHRLPFDSSDGFHHYAIAWGAEAIEWRIDGELIRRDERVAGEPWPEKPMFLYASVWDASHINDGKWTGTYHGRNAPYVCSYKDIRVPLALSLEEVEDPYQCATAGDAPAATAAADAVEKVDADVPAATTAADAVDAGDASATSAVADAVDAGDAPAAAADAVDAGDAPAATAAADAVEGVDAGAGKD